jgi:hypothetical protein
MAYSLTDLQSAVSELLGKGAAAKLFDGSKKALWSLGEIAASDVKSDVLLKNCRAVAAMVPGEATREALFDHGRFAARFAERANGVWEWRDFRGSAKNVANFIEKHGPGNITISRETRVAAQWAMAGTETTGRAGAVASRLTPIMPNAALDEERVALRATRMMRNPVTGSVIVVGGTLAALFGLREYFRGEDRDNRFTMVPVPQPGMEPMALPPQAMAFGPTIGNAATLATGRQYEGQLIDPGQLLAAGR